MFPIAQDAGMVMTYIALGIFSVDLLFIVVTAKNLREWKYPWAFRVVFSLTVLGALVTLIGILLTLFS